MPKEKIKEAPEGLKLSVAWLFVLVGVPSVVSALWRVTIKYTFE